jgi:hypothetical protein
MNDLVPMNDLQTMARTIARTPYHSVSIDGRILSEHTAVVERVLGRKLPIGAVVHHVDGDGRNNVTTNLVICPSQAYHKLIHMREKALRISGNPAFRPCHICKTWDAPENLYFRKSKPGQWHRACNDAKRKERKNRNAN